MNRRPSGLQLSKAAEGFLQYKTAEGLSNWTMISYRHHLKVFLEYYLEREGDVDIARVTTQQLRPPWKT